MKQPLAIVLYEKLMPGSQLVNRMQDLGYRVVTLNKPADLLDACLREKPMLVIADLASREKNVCPAISSMKEHAEASHIPIIAIADSKDPRLEPTAREAGATLVVSEAAVHLHLTQLLDQALDIQ